ATSRRPIGCRAKSRCSRGRHPTSRPCTTCTTTAEPFRPTTCTRAGSTTSIGTSSSTRTPRSGGLRPLPAPLVGEGDEDQHHDAQGDPRGVAGERNAEEAELHDVAGDAACCVDVVELVETDVRTGSGAGGRPGPEAPFDARMVDAHI